MCQAYEAERSFIVHSENIATVKGFVAARRGEPKKSNPYHEFEKYSREAWDHGWRCWNSNPPVLPWALEQQLPSGERTKARLCFEKTRELPEVLLQEVESWDQVAVADAFLEKRQ
ncbi:MAG: hypothetical protein HYT98_04190 [Candidatus Sungbacteria bacterium]|nr:hypothetical protein [Candidatus Sungbacteria bacterium]